jgi:hypothetical protein
LELSPKRQVVGSTPAAGRQTLIVHSDYMDALSASQLGRERMHARYASASFPGAAIDALPARGFDHFLQLGHKMLHIESLLFE